MRPAVRQGDNMIGNVPHHAQHILYWVSMAVGENIEEFPVYCTGHPVTGQQSTGSPTVFVNGRPLARLGDRGSSTDPCDGSNYINTTGSSTVFANGRKTVRLEDTVSLFPGSGKMTSGSSNVFIGG